MRRMNPRKMTPKKTINKTNQKVGQKALLKVHDWNAFDALLSEGSKVVATFDLHEAFHGSFSFTSLIICFDCLNGLQKS